jgi:hypothetical protein
MQAQQCGDVLANLFAFHIFASACGEGSGFKITLLRLHSRYGQFAGRVLLHNFGDVKLVDD